MTMTNEEARTFIETELMPIVEVSDLHVFGTLVEDFEALELALTSGNNTLVFAMADYIAKVVGLLNGEEIAQCITSKLLA